MDVIEIKSLWASVMNVDALSIGRVYAEALLRNAAPQHQEQELLDELTALVEQVFRAQPHLEQVFSSGALGREKKEALIRKVFGGRCSDLLLRFLIVLNNHDRLGMLRAVLAEYRTLLDQKVNRVRVQVRSAVELSQEEQDRLRGTLRQRLQREPLLETQVEPALLGGLVVRVDDHLWDGSVRARLQAIRNQLIERGTHALQNG
jgi:F-type H+-transporting ATPase subunit delta